MHKWKNLCKTTGNSTKLFVCKKLLLSDWNITTHEVTYIHHWDKYR